MRVVTRHIPEQARLIRMPRGGRVLVIKVGQISAALAAVLDRLLRQV